MNKMAIRDGSKVTAADSIDIQRLAQRCGVIWVCWLNISPEGSYDLIDQLIYVGNYGVAARETDRFSE